MDSILVASVVLASIAIGLSPVLLPARVRLSIRWVLALLLLGASLWFNHTMEPAREPYHLILLIPFWLALSIAMLVLPFHPKAKPSR